MPEQGLGYRTPIVELRAMADAVPQALVDLQDLDEGDTAAISGASAA